MTIISVNQNDYGDKYCLACCYLAIATYYGKVVTMQKLKDDGIVTANGFVNRWGVHFTRASLATKNEVKVKTAIDNNTPVIIKGSSGSYDHFVIAYDYSGSTIKVMDPIGGVFGDLGATTLKTWTGYYVCTQKA